MDIEASLTGGSLRAWLTTFWLSFPRLLVAYWIHFGSPSKVAAMAVIRICLQKYGRIPTWVVTDNGKEFLGEDYQVLLADLGSGPKYRPAHQARSGSPLESAWHAHNAHLIHNLPGNTKIMRNVRQVTKSMLPANLAQLSLTQIDHKVGAYYNIVNSALHPALEERPNAYYARHMQLLGERGHVFRPWTPKLYILTLPSLGLRKVHPQGVKYKYFHYYNAVLANHHGEDLRVRYDPLDITHIYVLVEETWVRCTCPHLADKAARSEAQLKLASVAMRANITGVIRLREMDIAMRILPYLELMPAEPTITRTVEAPQPIIEVKTVPPLTDVQGPPDTVDTSRQSGSSDSTEKQTEGRKKGKRTFTVLPTEDL